MLRRWQTLLLLLLLPAPWTPALFPVPANPELGQPVLFSETGHTLAYNFRVFYEALDGPTVFGQPLTEVFVEHGWPTQFFERARLEWRADLAQTQIADLGRWAAAGHEHEPAFQPVARTGPAIYFDATGHTLGGDFQRFYTEFGGRAVFGAPISEPFREIGARGGQGRVVQYFERARFELRTELSWPANVVLSDLGRQYLAAHPAPLSASTPVASANQALAAVRPTHIEVPRIGVDVDVEERGSTMGAWDVPNDDVGHFWPISALPGAAGNIVLGGHSGVSDQIFNHLPSIQVGDEILVTSGGGPRRYVVEQLLIVLPQETTALRPTPDEQLTLITCYPIGVNSHRLIVRALPA